MIETATTDPRIVDLERVARACGVLAQNLRRDIQRNAQVAKTDAEGVMIAYDRGAIHAYDEIRLRITALVRGSYQEPTPQELGRESDP